MTIRDRSAWLVGIVLATLVLGQASAGAEQSLSGNWRAVGGAPGEYEIHQSGSAITWYGHADDGHSWAHDFTGTIQGSDIVGTFKDRPGFDAQQQGTVRVHIVDACHLNFASASVGWGTTDWTKEVCALPAQPVPIASVSNGCGGAGWDSLVAAQNYLGNTSVYANSNINPLARRYKVNFVQACNLHDAGYSGAVVRDPINGGVVDFRNWSRQQVDKKFLDDMRLLCRRHIPARAAIALRNCLGRGGNASFGAESRFNFVRRWGKHFFDADPTQPGAQRTGLRANN